MTSQKPLKCAVVIFVKTLGVSPLKTRLAKGIGRQKADEFYRLSCASVAQVVNDFAESSQKNDASYTVEPYWAVAEAECLNHRDWQAFPRIWQGHGSCDIAAENLSLGMRLHLVYQQLIQSHDLVVFLGADCPQISLAALSSGVDLLADSSDFVLGDAADGGFWFFGGRLQVAESVWTSVPYSCETTSQDLARCLVDSTETQGPVAKIESFVDADEAKDLDLLLDALKNQKSLPASVTPSQQVLADWLDCL